MNARDRFGYEAGNRLVSVGLGLNTIADLLGADDSEHHLQPAHLNGLAHTVAALAELVKRDAYDLCCAFDPDDLPAQQRAVADLNEALSAASKPTGQRKGGAK